MKAKLIDGKKVSDQVRERLRVQVDALEAEGITPGLAVVLVGEDQASKVYVNNKKRACAEMGVYSEEYILPVETTQAQLLSLIEKLNGKPDIDGILIQLPLPAHMEEKTILSAITPRKDVDAFHPLNVGQLLSGNYRYTPCTPGGIMELLAATGTQVDGKECVVVGRSNIVGKPVAMLLLEQNGTVTICHSHTKNLAEICCRADILICAVGKAKLITADMVKPGAVVIDVGMNRAEDGRLCGDVDFEAVAEVAGAITPVPGGVGPMTITMLIKNTIEAANAALE